MPFFIQPLPPTLIENVRTISSQGRENKSLNTVENFPLDKDLLDQAYFKDKFNSLKAAWENKTMFSSSISSIINDVNFKRIIQMGSKAIPLIINEIEKKPSNLVWALNLITGATIKSNYRLTVTDACKIWVKQYKAGKII